MRQAEQLDSATVRRAVPSLRSLSDQELSVLMSAATVVHVERCAVVIAEGEPAPPLLFILDGCVRVSMAQRHGPPTIIGDYGAGHAIGLSACFDTGAASATVEAIEACALLRVDRARFYALGSRGEPSVFKVMRGCAAQLIERLRASADRIDGLFSRPDEGVAELERALLRQASDGRRG